jgi:hypothetical protein
VTATPATVAPTGDAAQSLEVLQQVSGLWAPPAEAEGPFPLALSWTGAGSCGCGWAAHSPWNRARSPGVWAVRALLASLETMTPAARGQPRQAQDPQAADRLLPTPGDSP